MLFWTSVEWGGAFLGLLGAYFLANKKYSPTKAWIAWLVSDLFFILLFGLYTGQHGLLLMHVFGFAIAVIGLVQWSSDNKSTISTNTQDLIFFSSLIAGALAILSLLSMPFIGNPLLPFEWFAALLSISGGLMMASKHKLAPLSWIAWTVGNASVLILTLITQQYGVVVLQVGYTALNLYGCYTWLYKKKFISKLKKVKHMNARILEKSPI